MVRLFKFILLTGLRDKLYLSLILVIFFIFALSSFVGSLALAEGAQMQLAYFSFLSRVTTACGLILFICFYIHRLFENREIDFILSGAISRKVFILTCWLGFTTTAVILLIPVVLIQVIFNRVNLFGLLCWTTSVLCEAMMISTAAIVSSLVLESVVVSILSSALFYFVARMMGFFVYSIQFPTIESFKSIMGIAETLLMFVSTIFPRLDLFGKTEWLIQGADKNICIILLQSVIYVPLMLCAATSDFKKKQF